MTITRNRIIPMLRVRTAAGSDPDVIEIDDCREVYLDPGIDQDELGNVFCPCDKSPSGQCEYDSTDRICFDRCIHCRRITG